MKIFIGIMCWAIVPLVTMASGFNDSVDRLFSAIDKEHAPGCNVGVIHDGKLIHKAGYGLSNLKLGVRLNGSNVHRIASISKQFTAMSVLLLADEGKINLQDDIRKYLPQLRKYRKKVTINAMLGHSSGMADYDYISNYPSEDIKGGLNFRNSMGKPFRLGNEDYLSINEFYALVKQVPLRHDPDVKWYYSNLAYFLLSMLVEEVSGESLRHYAAKRIFEPLKMRDTFYSDDPTEIVKNRASGYKKNAKGEYQIDMTNLFWVGDGGLHTTVDDLLKWNQQLHEPILGRSPKKLLALFNRPNTNFKSDGSMYANGQMVSQINTRTVYSHGGAWLGVNALYSRIPEEKFATIILCNDTSQKPDHYASQIIALYFQE